MGVMDDAERLEPTGPTALAEWSAWLAAHHAEARGVWLVTPRRAVDRDLGYDAAVVEALRYGWVDSTQRPVDETRTMQWFGPRRAQSVWTRLNKQRVARLEAEQRMEPAGAAAVEAAKANGYWTLMDDAEDLVVPPDLAAALDEAGAREAWDALSPSARKAALGWIVTARRQETREVRVAETAARTARGERPR